MEKPVTVFSTPFCAPCERLKAYLKAQGVAFTVRDLMLDEDAAEMIEDRNIRTSPVLQVGETLYHGPDLHPDSLACILAL
ncbi:MAG: glutaredoxin family protein [Alphaproteobacteria bacterium]